MFIVSAEGESDSDGKPGATGMVLFGGIIALFLSMAYCVNAPSTRIEKGTARLVCDLTSCGQKNV